MRIQRRDKFRRHQDQQFDFVLLLFHTAKSGTHPGQVREPRQPLVLRFGLRLNQPGERQSLTGVHFNGGVGPACTQSGDGRAVDRYATRRVDLADLGTDFQSYASVAKHDWDEVHPCTELAVFHGGRAESLGHQDGKLAA